LIGIGIKGILFDVDGTLYGQFPIRAYMLGVLLFDAALGADLSAIRIIRCFRDTREDLRRLPQGSGLADLQYTQVAEKLGVGADEVRGAVEKFIYEKPLGLLRRYPRGNLRATLSRLKAKGYRLGVLSDYPAADKLEALGVGPSMFDAVVDATMPEVDAFKPDPRGFLYASGLMGLAPADVLYVGDREAVDMKGAESAGMPGVLLKRSITGDAIVDGGRGYGVTGSLASLERSLKGADIV